MGKVFSSAVKRPLKNYNLESRVFKQLDKNDTLKPEAAPKHATTRDKLEQFKQDNPAILNLQKERSEKLHSMLKGIVVNPDKVGEIVQRPLPEKRGSADEMEYGYAEPDRVPEGKATFRKVLEFINNSHAEPGKHTVQSIALQYKLPESTVRSILKHFHMLQVQLPRTPQDTPDTPTVKVLGQRTIKDITPGEIKSEKSEK